MWVLLFPQLNHLNAVGIYRLNSLCKKTHICFFTEQKSDWDQEGTLEGAMKVEGTSSID